MESRAFNNLGSGFYAGDRSASLNDEFSDTSNGVEWQASEYIHHEKGAGWVLALIAVGIALVTLAVFLAQWTLALVLVVMIIAFGYYALRKPKIVSYRLDHSTLTIAGKEYPLTSFRAFGVVEEGAFYSIRLIPVKRFGLLQVAYVSEKEGEAVVDILGAQLPMEEMHSDPLEKFMSKLRF